MKFIKEFLGLVKCKSWLDLFLGSVFLTEQSWDGSFDRTFFIIFDLVINCDP